ncbi:MAG: gluzincin family metallopeptidase [Gemmatimonadaceae bacterium]
MSAVLSVKVVLVLLLLASTTAFASTAGAQADLRARVDALVETGKLADAESAARSAGAGGAVALAEVLVLRGQLASADSVAQAAARANGAERRQAQVISAELAARRGDRAAATRAAAAITGAYEDAGTAWPARDKLAAGRAYLLLAERDAGAVRSALRAFDAAAAADPALLDAPLRAADLLLAKYNAPDAKVSYEAVLKKRPDHPRAVLGLARVEEFEGKGSALATARRALSGNVSLTPAHLFIAKLHLEAEADDSAGAAARRALAVDPSAAEGWATIGAVAWLRGDSAGFRDARASAARLNPRPSAFYVTLADAASRQRRYADAERFSAQALALDSSSVPALGALGTNRLRAGDIAGGRVFIKRAFEIDPFNLWHKNTLDLLDELATFRTTRMGRFEFVAPAREADLLLPLLSPLLEEAYDKLAARYGYRPPTPVRLEIYERHADFSVRTVGLTGLGALGVSFGRVLAMDAPSARAKGSFNWGSTAWHELAHTFTLGLSGNRVPRWFSEGASVLEERRARPGFFWGADVSPAFMTALRANALRPVSTLNDGFVRPRNAGEVLLSYYQASLVCEMIEAEFGAKALGDMLRAWGEGLETPAVLQRVLKVDEPTLDKRFNDWLAKRFVGKIDPDTLRNDSALEPLVKEAAARERARDDVGLATVLERMIWIWPYDQDVHVKLAEAAARSGNPGRVVRARRAVVALGPTDMLEARYQLGRALLAAGDSAGARREVLGVLEQAPTFEKAQALLLELRSIPAVRP